MESRESKEKERDWRGWRRRKRRGERVGLGRVEIVWGKDRDSLGRDWKKRRSEEEEGWRGERVGGGMERVMRESF